MTDRVAERRPDPALLLHGQPGAAGDWDRVRGAIAGRVPTIALDRPGWDGRSGPSDLRGNVEAALAALDEAGVARATVVGHSFGAAVAAWLAAFHPGRVGALVLVAPAANRASLYRLDYWLATPVAGYLASVASLGGLGVALATGPIRRRIAEELALDDRYLQGRVPMLLAPRTWRAYAAEQRVLVRDLPLLEERLGDIKAPTTVIGGTADRIVPGASMRELAGQIPYAELVLLERAGHLLPLQEPERLAYLIGAASAAVTASVPPLEVSPAAKLPGND
jgi:pimeloyl-ACP methyl ester carboxylesterase